MDQRIDIPANEQEVLIQQNNVDLYNFDIINQEISRNSIMQAAKTNNFSELNSAIDSNQPIYQLRDRENRTVLHYLALNKNLEIFDRVILAYPTQIKEWLQKEDNFGLQAVHYVVFRGNIELYKRICEFYTPDKIIGMAAAGNQVLLLYQIIVDDQFDPNQEHQYGITPLHLACYHKANEAASFLIKQGLYLNSQDAHGNTPLHISAVVENKKLAKKLIKRGADVNIVNKQNQEFCTITENIEIQDLFCKEYFSCCLGSTVSKIIFLIINVGSWVLLYDQTRIKDVYWFFVSFFITAIITVVSFYIVSESDPGYIQSDNNEELPNLWQQYEPEDVCVDCCIKKQDRSCHCVFCQRCIQEYDHHCPFINNCVGRKNIKSYRIFVVALFLNVGLLFISTLITVFGSQYFTKPIYYNTTVWVILLILEIGLILFLIFIMIVQVKNYCQNQTSYERARQERQNDYQQNSNQSQDFIQHENTFEDGQMSRP